LPESKSEIGSGRVNSSGTNPVKPADSKADKSNIPVRSENQAKPVEGNVPSKGIISTKNEAGKAGNVQPGNSKQNTTYPVNSNPVKSNNTAAPNQQNPVKSENQGTNNNADKNNNARPNQNGGHNNHYQQGPRSNDRSNNEKPRQNENSKQRDNRSDQDSKGYEQQRPA